MDDYYVYAHIDKDNHVPFYIGIGTGRRAYSKERHEYWHLYISKYAPTYEVQFIATDVSEYYAREIENFFIGKFGKIHTGQGLLVNWTDGGLNEGVYVRIGSQDETIDFEDKLTEFGKKLFLTEKKTYDLSKCNLFIRELAEETIFDCKKGLLEEIDKKSNPRIPWLVPFCLTETTLKSELYGLKVTNRIELIEKVNCSINLSKLPIRRYVDNVSHRIMIYFDILLQENVQLVNNDQIVSRSDSDWYFYKDYWHAYLKVIQCIYSGKELKIKYIGKNKISNQSGDIYDFEVSMIKPQLKGYKLR